VKQIENAVTMQPIRLLLSEDNPADVELEVRELRRAGLKIEHVVAITGKDYIGALREFRPDIIVSDFSMPEFDGMEALRIAREMAPDIPFLFVSGTLGEDYAIRALKNGATDYVLKSNLVRLPGAMERALSGAEERHARRRAEAGLRRAQLMAKLAHIVTGRSGEFEGWSESLADLLGVEPGSVPRSTREWLDLLHPADRDLFRRASLDAAAAKKRVDIDYRLRHDGGSWIHVRQVIEPLSAHADAEHGGRWFSTLQDVTEQKVAEAAVRRLNRVYAVLSGINALIVRARTRDELFREACRIAVGEGRFPLVWIGLVDASQEKIDVAASAGDAEGYLSKMPMTLNAQDDDLGMAGRAVLARAPLVANDIESDGRVLIKEEALARGFRSLAALPLAVGERVMGVIVLYAEQAGFFDEAEMKLLTELAGDIAFAVHNIAKAEQVEYLSYHDPLTGLANRMLLMDRLAQFIKSNEPGRMLALVTVDIERFKTINDTLGRAAGDALLAKLAASLTQLAGDANRVARIGADQFAVVIPNVKAMESIARAINQGVARVEAGSFRIGDAELRIAIRSGIAVYPGDGADAETVFRNSEAALKKAKLVGDKYLFYAHEMTARVAERLSLENKLRLAVEKQEFVLHYQPKVSLVERKIVGVEALLRWQTPQGLVPPLKFIPLLEDTGLILQVGAWALRRALLDHRLWAEQGVTAPRIAVNVSAIQLRQKNFVALLEQVIAEGTTPTALDLEITESLVMDDIEGNIEKLRRVRALGVGIAIDDFGTGYSSLSYLARLPVGTLKIDRSFVSTMNQNPDTATLVQTIISMSHSLRLNVVAEGVETEEQATFLRLLRCNQAQGYLFGKPLPFEQLTQLLKSG
jgi:diguanylate cyclase (GGDEF)-like protein